jgi:hypothetical protein
VRLFGRFLTGNSLNKEGSVSSLRLGIASALITCLDRLPSAAKSRSTNYLPRSTA